MATNYKNTSNYRNTKINDKYLEHYEPPFTVSFDDTNVITLEQKYNYRPDLLAYDLYGDADLWWVFVLYNRNKILDPIYDFTTGLVIRVPKSTSVIGI